MIQPVPLFQPARETLAFGLSTTPLEQRSTLKGSSESPSIPVNLESLENLRNDLMARIEQVDVGKIDFSELREKEDSKGDMVAWDSNWSSNWSSNWNSGWQSGWDSSGWGNST